MVGVIHSVSSSLCRQVWFAVKRLWHTPLAVNPATVNHPSSSWWMHTRDNVAEKSHSKWRLNIFCASLWFEPHTFGVESNRFTNSATPPLNLDLNWESIPFSLRDLINLTLNDHYVSSGWDRMTITRKISWDLTNNRYNTSFIVTNDSLIIFPRTCAWWLKFSLWAFGKF